MKHLIMGTAGHIDHGKTALIKALTGVECDTHKEEKARGITINLGFTHIETDSGDTIGIIDVPGHKGFINTMVAGVSGIDFVLLVISADSGVMPQTVEHLNVMEILGIKHGIIVVTKIDLVDSDVKELAVEEIKDFTKGTFLDGMPIVPVSSVTGYGLETLRLEISSMVSKINQRFSGEIFRMFIDRIFTISGFGTVVTGSVISGELSTEDEAYLLPSEKTLRVRRMEKYGKTVSKVMAGDRASINLVGLNKDDFSRGMIISNKLLRSTILVDATLKLFNYNKKFKIWGHGIFLLGTYEAQVKFHIIDKDSIENSDSAIIQIYLPNPCICTAGDKYVLRSTSSDITIGGGRIIDAFPLHHRKRKDKVIKNLSRIASGDLTELIYMEVKKSNSVITSKNISDRLNISNKKIKNIIDNKNIPGVDILKSDDEYFLIIKEIHKRNIKDIIERIKKYHRDNPLNNIGLSAEELIGIGKSNNNQENLKYIQITLELLLKKNIVKKIKHTWAMRDFNISVGKKLNSNIKIIENYFAECKLKTPLMSDVETLQKKNNIDKKQLNQILRFLLNNKKIYAVEKTYIHKNIVDLSRNKLVDYLNKNENITVSEFRDLINGNRKLCLHLFSIFDEEGTTKRINDVRILSNCK